MKSFKDYDKIPLNQLCRKEKAEENGCSKVIPIINIFSTKEQKKEATVKKCFLNKTNLKIKKNEDEFALSKFFKSKN